MNAFLEPIRDRRKALDKDPKLVWDMLEAGNAKARARASRNLDALKKKLNFIFREGRKMPPAAGGSAPDLDLENNDACWRAKPRANRRHCFPQAGFPKGLSPFAAGGILPLCFLTFTQLSLVADDCKKLLVESMNAFLEPIRDRRKALDKDPKLVWDMLEAGNAKARARASRNLDALKKKLNFIFREGRKMPPAAGGLSPRPPTWKNGRLLAREAARQQASLFSPRGFPKGLSPFAAGGILPLAS